MTEKTKEAMAHKNIATALAAAQSQMTKAQKSAANPHLKSKYADLGSVMDACLPSLTQNGIALLQPIGEDESGRYVETLFIHSDSGETLSCRVPMIMQKNDMQGLGSAITYARRYGLMSMAGVAPEDDDGHGAGKDDGRKPQARPEHDGPSEAQINGAIAALADARDEHELRDVWVRILADVKRIPEVQAKKDARKAELEIQITDDNGVPDNVPF